MRRIYTTLLLFLMIIIIPAAGFAQNTAPAGDITEVPDETAEPEGFTVSIDLRTGVNLIGFIPGIPAFIGVPMSISSNTFTITPEVGFIYYFDVWTDIHNSFYIPLGLSAIYNPMNLGIDLLYYVPVGGTNTNYMMSAAAVTESAIISAGSFSLMLELKIRTNVYI